MIVRKTLPECASRQACARFSIHAGIRAAATVLCAGVIPFSLALADAPAQDTVTASADAEFGRQIFNGKGICSYCHGQDGYIGERPSLKPETEAVIKRLAPHPPNLRNAAALRVRTDPERFALIRKGHTGTGMLPDTRLIEKEITQILAYLSVLRKQGPAKP
jgi:hypothetical protein